MEKLLSEKFYKNLENNVISFLENEANRLVIKKIDWENESNRCFLSLKAFFGALDLKSLKENGIEKIGAVDICWNEYGGDIEVDFMPDNNFDTAFDDGCIMNNSAIDNDVFFNTYFDVDGEKSWEKIGDDYLRVISAFEYLIMEIISFVVESEAFKRLPRKSPCHVGFAGFHDEGRVKIFTIA